MINDDSYDILMIMIRSQFKESPKAALGSKIVKRLLVNSHLLPFEGYDLPCN